MYMSPEQWKTTSVDIRADIYSLGCALYHLLAGQAAVSGIPTCGRKRPTSARSCRRSKSRPPIPRPVWEIVEKMTAKRPEDRYADPAEVATALAPWAHGHQLVQLVEQVDARRTSRDAPKAPQKSDTRRQGCRLGNAAWPARRRCGNGRRRCCRRLRRAWRSLATAARRLAGLGPLRLAHHPGHPPPRVGRSGRQSQQAALQARRRLCGQRDRQGNRRPLRQFE